MTLPAIFRALRRDRRGNVLMIFGAALLPLTFATGMSIDYARAMKVRTKLNALADSAALYAVSKPIMPTADGTAQQTAIDIFNAQAQTLVASGRVTITSVTATVSTDANGRRTAVLTYAGTTPNAFAGILGKPTLAIGGTSTTTNAIAPDIDFYMLLDVSGSMALPTTTAGLRIVANSNDKNCQFACHSVNDQQGLDANGNWTDLYGVAKSYNLPLRIDAEGVAVSKLVADAQSTSSKNGATYRMAIATFRGAGGFASLHQITDGLAAAATKTTNLTPYQYYSENCATQACLSTDVGAVDQDTGSSDAFDNMNRLMPDPGTGIGPNSKPQQIMFIVTDGMRDEQRVDENPEVAFDTAKCDMIKRRGIRIAILYTEYLRESLDNLQWAQIHVAPYMYKLEPALQACASPGLYTKVSTDQDIYTALDALFQNAVATARISR